MKHLVALSSRAFPWRATYLMVLKALDQVAEAYLRRRPVVWHNVFFPTEILYGLRVVPFAPEAASALAVGLGLASEALNAASAHWVATDICSFHRLAAGLDLAGYFPTPDAVVCTSHLCDIAPQSLAWSADRHGKPFYLLDVPQRAKAEDATYVARQLKYIFYSLARDLGLSPDMEALKAAIGRSNEARRLLLEINADRQKLPAVIRGEEAHGFLYLMLTGWGADFTEEVYRELLEELKTRRREKKWAASREKFRLLWLHLRPYYPTEIFKILEEESGAIVVFEEMHHVYWEELDLDRPFYSLALKVLGHQGLSFMERRIQTILDMVREFNAQGVIHFAHWGCRQSTAGIRLLQEALRRENTAFLNLDGDCIDREKYAGGGVRTRLEAFLELLAASRLH
ncbi:MAG: 2-hydroxyacyl-CoA dehydratase family protein [Thermanaeromonas sp.]|uniref:2-hydroxyacyl-CoA dehydratase subunit D n=1 Tax=Thermanaeromonas sp. TaxID=2003697 RepID=UPI00243E730E|nr:2-hydroxyacyl-CoA dehydratase family protein [Thermanaeromonas sp.]MCG0277166.1 2-hydroxyacyl-CoA dehydratase family protein [Thermanaeromonas sp.]